MLSFSFHIDNIDFTWTHRKPKLSFVNIFSIILIPWLLFCTIFAGLFNQLILEGTIHMNDKLYFVCPTYMNDKLFIIDKQHVPIYEWQTYV